MEKVISNKEMQLFGYSLEKEVEISIYEHDENCLKLSKKHSKTGSLLESIITPMHYDTTPEHFMNEVERLNALN